MMWLLAVPHVQEFKREHFRQNLYRSSCPSLAVVEPEVPVSLPVMADPALLFGAIAAISPLFTETAPLQLKVK
jgi:hypothetical protein